MKPVLICTLFACVAVIYADWIDDLGKCDVGDGGCEETQFNKAVAYLSDNGAPDLEIPKLDKLQLNDIKIKSLHNQASFELTTGTLEGIKKCNIHPVETSPLNPGYFTVVDINCPKVVLEAKYKAQSNGIASLLLPKQVVRGDGDLRIQVDDLFLRLYKPYDIVEDEGKLYVDCKNDNNTYGYNFNINKKVTFKATKVYFLNTDISGIVNANLNYEWKFYVSQYGKDFFDKIVEIIYKLCHKFFDNVPADRYMSNPQPTS